jgi:hypothetical protein
MAYVYTIAIGCRLGPAEAVETSPNRILSFAPQTPERKVLCQFAYVYTISAYR